jgi:hypothetical protein
MLGVSLCLAGRRRGSFSPRALFANGEQGAWYDPSDLASMFQDTAASVPAAVGAAVARINDRSGRGNHAGQPAAAARPVLRRDAGGRLYLDFDGVDDRLVSAPFALPHPWERLSALRQTAWAAGARVFANGSGASATGLLMQSGAAPALALFDGAAAAANGGAALGRAAVIAERRAGAGSSLTVGDGAASSGNPGSIAASGLSIGADPGGGNAAAFALYGLCVVKGTIGAAALARLKAWLAAKAGA